MPSSSSRSEPLAQAQPGDRFTYSHPNGFGYGQHARGEVLTAEMTELDLQDGMEVQVVEYDQDTGWALVEWTDTKAINRITTIDPQYLDMFIQI